MIASNKLQVAVFLLFVSVSVPLTTGTDDNDPRMVRWRMPTILKEVSETVGKNYYDPKMNGVDWKASTEIARQRIDKADHTGEMVAAITGLLARLNDSHTVFIPPGRTEHPLFGFDAKPFGDEVLVYDIMPKGPADLAGLQAGDRILAVNEFRATRDNIDIMMRYFRFLNPSHILRLTIDRGGTTNQVISIEAKLQSEFSKDFSHLYNTYAHERKEDFMPQSKDYDSGIVYLRFPSFMTTTHDAGAFIGRAKNARAVILDLRENGGGRVDSMEEIAGHLFDERAKLADFVGRDKTVPVEVKSRAPHITAPLLVMVDSHSASASEMLARYVQIRHRGKVMGDRTSARVNAALIFPGEVGSVYQVFYATEIAVARAVMADGEGLEGKGVLPDELCVPTRDDLRSSKDPCLNRALELARSISLEKASSPPSNVGDQATKHPSPLAVGPQ
jgi:carboxyl-terminal processing protease